MSRPRAILELGAVLLDVGSYCAGVVREALWPSGPPPDPSREPRTYRPPEPARYAAPPPAPRPRWCSREQLERALRRRRGCLTDPPCVAETCVRGTCPAWEGSWQCRHFRSSLETCAPCGRASTRLQGRFAERWADTREGVV